MRAGPDAGTGRAPQLRVEPADSPAASHRRRRPWIWAFTGVIAAVVIVLAVLATAVPLSSDSLRHRVIAALSDRLDSDVTLGDLHLRLFPRLHVEGSALVIRKRGRENVPPLISVKQFSADADLVGLMRKHVAHVQLIGLDIEVPPGRHHHDQDDEDEDAPATKGSGRAVVTTGTAPATGDGTRPSRAAHDSPGPDAYENGVVVDAMDSTDARLAIISSHADKPPKVWDIHTLHMDGVGVSEAMPYRATLTNGIPRGEIATKGSFGPWHRDEPGDTPLDGTYTFDKADLSIFKGIAGILSSRGSFGGTLARIDARGETDTPDFTIDVSGHPFPLHTAFHTIIDGTNGDTILERIDASFLRSALVAKGGVIDTPGKAGRSVSLDVTIDRARLEDIMTMAVKTPKPPMTGALTMTTTFLLPPGDADVVDRLRLDGHFAIADARFTNYDVQGKINELSHRGRGKSPESPKSGVLSKFDGRFSLGGGRLHLPSVGFAVPGAAVKLAGSYALRPETLDFKGLLLLDAKISDTQTGIKSILLKAVDPLFKQRGGSGSAIPIQISGTRDDPSFGLDVHRVFHHGDAR